MKRMWRDLGTLRLLMMGLVLVLMLVAPFSLGNDRDGMAILITLVAPALYVMMIFVLPLDMLMSFIFRADKTGPERLRMNRILRIEVIAFIAMNLSWLPFVAKLLGA